ncbi:MAG: bifunctional phosphoribosylaminoimidazolecarboxamide formyltransferase/IMP cyclohydrolase [Planctomycetaceae bacterium]
MSTTERRRALVSVSDKSGIEPFVSGLVEQGFEILSTGGTRQVLEQAGIPVIDVADYTGFPEMMSGRVKTLHPKVHGAILGRPDNADDAAAMNEHGIIPFQVVVCNLYPFEETVARENVTLPEAIEQIDIGGPSMIRSAAKNHAYITVVTSPSQYEKVLAAIAENRLDATLRRELAQAAFTMTANYDRAISEYLLSVTNSSDSDNDGFGDEISIFAKRKLSLRYGENPHQRAGFYVEQNAASSTLARAEQLHGKELSYNNLLDLDAAMCIARSFQETSAVVIKHTNPCGCAIAMTQAEAFDKAYAGDPVSAFGSILGFNREVDGPTAEKLCEPNRFIEAIIAPGFSPEAFELLTTRPKWKKNVRLMACPDMNDIEQNALDVRRVTGGFLIQDRDETADDSESWQCVTDRKPTESELRDLKFGWTVCRHVKSNAIVYANNGAVVGVGAGQMSRLDSAFIAAHKAGDRARGGVVASDAFFPFRDGVDEAAKVGITAVIQPGGSRNDDEVIAACNEHGMAMLFTGRRHFRH